MGLRKVLTTEFFRSVDIYILSYIFDYAEKRRDKKVKITSKIYGIIDWTANNCNVSIAILRSRGNKTVKFGQLIGYLCFKGLDKQ